MAWKTLDDMDLHAKVVLVRVDINVPVHNGKVTDATRITRILPTLRDILARGGKPVMLAHFGRPKGKYVPELSLRVVLPTLEKKLGQPVIFIEKPNRAAIDATPEGSVILIENTRFAPGEETNDPNMAKFLASLADIYCNDAFSAAHRAHASTTGVAQLLPACAGRLMQSELSALGRALDDPERPAVAVVGGAKISSKLDLLGNLVEKVDYLVIGGGMANTFLVAHGISVGKSLAEHTLARTARGITEKALAAGCQIILPVDVVVAEDFKAHAPSHVVAADACPPQSMILDAGPRSIAQIKEVFAMSKTLIWNGPLGAFELPPFDTATNECARYAAMLTRAGKLVSVAGGGDTVGALNQAGVADDFTYISTAGGAFLEWMEGKTLPGVAALEDTGEK